MRNYILYLLTVITVLITSTIACLSGIQHRRQVQVYFKVTRIHLNSSSGLYNCLEACDKDRNCTHVMVEKLEDVKCYIQNGTGNYTLKSGPNVSVLHKRVVRDIEHGPRSNRSKCTPCASREITTEARIENTARIQSPEGTPPNSTSDRSTVDTEAKTNSTDGTTILKKQTYSGTSVTNISVSNSSFTNTSVTDTSVSSNSTSGTNTRIPVTVVTKTTAPNTTTIGQNCTLPFEGLPIPGLRGGCYHVPGNFTNIKKSFEEAETACQALGSNSHLIHTESTQVTF